MPEVPPARRTAADVLHRIGLPGVVLLSALLADVVIIAAASVDSLGPRGTDLIMLPGILGMTACGLWARREPAVSAFAGAGVLVTSSVLIRLSEAAPYSTLLTHISFAETVAGFVLVYFCARDASGGIAFAAVSSLVVAALIAVAGRAPLGSAGGDELMQTLLLGGTILAVAVVAGLSGRGPVRRRARSGPVMEVLTQHWALVGALSLLLFFELAATLDRGPYVAPIITFSVAAAVLAVLATRRPVVAGVALAGVVLVSGLLFQVGHRYNAMVGGLTLTQVAAGMIVAGFLVRTERPARAWPVIGLLSAAVAVVATAFVLRYDDPLRMLSELRQLFVMALLMLGIAVASGLYLRSRDTQRNQALRTAVHDAQTAERMALARELHDVVAHHVTGIVVQAQAAKMLAERDPRVVVDALGRIETAGTEAMVAMRRLVRSMRGDAPAGNSEFSEQATTDLAADLRRLVETANHGVPTDVELDLPKDLPHEVARSALRLVQESLTNVGKHAHGATRATVSARVVDGELYLRVADDGRASGPRPGGDDGGWRDGGYGLVGMRERVELLHGRLTAGRAPDGGWVVEARLPLEGDE
ncbi:sensor histidine kinase [Amycolatopsis arida]|uniref:sensor histidine kinase n=1 Tax=Amycolatopsis arida TaxID=587909 RepID=UPI001FB97FE8|nr:histidine kinase [Amycolatopsis arida]